MTAPELLRTQVGVQTDRTTEAAPTVEVALWAERPKITPIVESESFPPAGSLAPSADERVTKRASGLNLPPVPVWEQLHIWLDAIFSKATAADNGNGTYTRVWRAPIGSAPTPTPLTVVHGAGSDVWKVVGVVGQALKLTHDSAEAIKLSLDAIGLPVAAGALADLTPASVTPIMGYTAALYLDAWDGTIGTTEVPGVKFGCELSADVKAENVFGACSQQPVAVRYARADGGLRMSLEYSAANAAVTSILAATDTAPKYQVRIRYAITAASGNTWTLDIDFAGAAKSAPALFEDNDGMVTADLELAPLPHSGLGDTWLRISLTNEVA